MTSMSMFPRRISACKILYAASLVAASGAVLFHGDLHDLHTAIQDNTIFACFFLHLVTEFPFHVW